MDYHRILFSLLFLVFGLPLLDAKGNEVISGNFFYFNEALSANIGNLDVPGVYLLKQKIL